MSDYESVMSGKCPKCGGALKERGKGSNSFQCPKDAKHFFELSQFEETSQNYIRSQKKSKETAVIKKAPPEDQ